jgi:hypothetical protein
MSWVGQCRAVVVGAVVQVLTAVPFVLGAVVVARYGARAQRAADAEVVRQGVPVGVLARHGISFGASGWDVPVAAGIALVLVALAVANLAGRPAARIVSYIAHPVLFVAGLLIVPGQVFTAWYLRRSFARSTDPDLLHRLDASALVTATQHVFPGWLLPVDVAKLALTTVGSVLVVVALSTRASRAFFRRQAGGTGRGTSV